MKTKKQNLITGSILSFVLLLAACGNTTNENTTSQQSTVQDTKVSTTKIIDKPFTDSRDGNVYKTITIGNQTWMAENLRFKASSGCWSYNYNESNAKTYGYLYDWETAKKVCPTGWHLPTDAEWKTLISCLGGVDIAGGKLKATTSWESPNSGATNESGFNALPGGLLEIKRAFHCLGTYGNWWSSTENNTLSADDVRALGYKCAWYCSLHNNESYVDLFSGGETAGFSVRCIKDN
jgi:uncharacterized protein (TIGR02145 family)